MGDNITLQLVVFFVATAIAIMSCHIALIRLAASGSESQITQALGKERTGVLVVVEFALVILVSAPIPIATTLIKPSAPNQFLYAVWIAPVVMLFLAIVDLCLTRGADCYYYAVAIVITLSSVLLLVLNWLSVMPSSLRFFAALSLSLLVILAQFLKSALRLANILS